MIDDSYIDTEWGDYLSEKKSVPTIPILNNKEKFNQKIIPFSEWHKLRDPHLIAWKMIEENAFVSNQIRIIFSKIIEEIKLEPKYVIELLKLEHEQRIWEKWGESIFRNILEVRCFAEPSNETVTQIHTDLEWMRWEQEYEKLEGMPIQDLWVWNKPYDHPILYEECYKKTHFINPVKE